MKSKLHMETSGIPDVFPAHNKYNVSNVDQEVKHTAGEQNSDTTKMSIVKAFALCSQVTITQ